MAHFNFPSPSVPTTATDGVALVVSGWSVRGYSVTIFASNEGATLAGTGALRAYVHLEGLGWVRVPDLDLPVDAGAAGARAQSWPDHSPTVLAAGRRVLHVPDGVGTSAGGVTVRYDLSTDL